MDRLAYEAGPQLLLHRQARAWVERASAQYKQFNSGLRVAAPMGPRGTFVVVGKMSYPTGLGAVYNVGR